MKRMVNGRTTLEMTGVELIRKLAILVPPPRVHQTRFHGCFAPNAMLRPEVIRKKPAAAPTPEPTPQEDSRVPHRIDWVSLLKRVFGVDVLQCGRCAGRMRVLALIEDPPVIEQILRHLGLPPVPLSTAPPRGQRRFNFGD